MKFSLYHLYIFQFIKLIWRWNFLQWSNSEYNHDHQLSCKISLFQRNTLFFARVLMYSCLRCHPYMIASFLRSNKSFVAAGTNENINSMTYTRWCTIIRNKNIKLNVTRRNFFTTTIYVHQLCFPTEFDVFLLFFRPISLECAHFPWICMELKGITITIIFNFY